MRPGPPSPARIGAAPAGRADEHTRDAGPDTRLDAPAELAGFALLRAHALTPEQRQACVATFRNVPRPPKLLQHLMSLEFLEAADSMQLVELISAEPLIAGKVLAAVNSPLYGLKTTVTSAGQAVTYLGLNTVRSLCLQYILITAFKTDSPERQQLLETTWRASNLAAELAHQLSYRLALPEPGLTVSAVVLSFLGRLATAATMPRALLSQIPARDLLQRARAEQERMGLPASEVGRLLMIDWGLPERIVAVAAEIDSVLCTPRAELDPALAPRLALAYLCARLGERLACGELNELLAFDVERADDAELFRLRTHLADPRLARLGDHLRAPMLANDLQRLMAAWR